MDEHTLRILEFDEVRRLVARYAPSALGRERVEKLVPSSDPAMVRSSLVWVSQMVRAIRLGHALGLGEIADIGPAVRRARAEAALPAETLRDVAANLHAMRRLREQLSRLPLECAALGDCAFRVQDLSRLAHEIEGIVDERARVVDSASRELARLRNEIEALDERIRGLMQRLLRSEAVRRALRYPNYTVTGSHYVLPVSRDHRHEVAGVVHRTSSSGHTLFIEPSEVAEINAELALLRSHEAREVRRILRQLSGEVGKASWQILDSLEVAAQLSFVAAKARYAIAFGMVEPRISDSGPLWLDQARHPILEHLFQEAERERRSDGEGAGAPAAELASHPPEQTARAAARSIVPIDVRLGDRYDVLVVTGPNTGGKTVALKTTGLLSLMAQAGLHIPAADGSTLPVFDHVLADIGDEQSLQQSLSTFSSHMCRVASILRAATARSLILLDELGAGTDPAEGAALGRAVLDELLEIRASAVVTTHLGDLKLYALSRPRAENAAVEFDDQTMRPLYRLTIGGTGRSIALVIARRLDLPGHLVDRAELYLEESRGDRPQELEVLEQRRAEAEAARTAAWQAEQEARRAREAYEARLEQLDRAAHDTLDLEQFRASLEPGRKVHVRKFRRPGIVLRVDHKRRLATVSHGSMQWVLELDELEPEPEGP